jgi:uncharacterized protein
MRVKVTTPSPEEVAKLNLYNWGEWECGVSTFPWSYDAEETCYIIEGHVTIETTEGKIDFKKGDLVVFPKGLSCKWIVHQPVRKYYKFA